MHATYLFQSLAIVGMLGLIVSGSPLEARQELSDDEPKALGVIKDKELGDFCDRLLSNNASKRDLDGPVHLFARQNVNTNVNNNEGDDQGDDISYSASYSNGQEDVDYKINTVTVPDDLKGYYPDAIEKACNDYKNKAKREVKADITRKATRVIQKRIITTAVTTTERITKAPTETYLSNPMFVPPRRLTPVNVQITALTIYDYGDIATPTLAVPALETGKFRTKNKGNLIHNIPRDFFGKGGAAGAVGKAGVV